MQDPTTRTALRLQYLTIGWNVGEAFLTIGLGIAAASLALVAFGTDSIIELFASGVVVWHLRRGEEGMTGRALRLLGGSFALLAVVLGTAAVRDLATGRIADASPWGIAYLGATALVMTGLGIAKRRAGAQLESPPLAKEGELTLLDGALAFGTLIGLSLNALVGWWWADPAAALLIAVVAANEAREAFEEAGEHDEVGESGR
ncbi:MAG: cation transporter [Acidimicrobiia bacterium]|nr:cation transporter [Acidimicrobiia bacterium]